MAQQMLLLYCMRSSLLQFHQLGYRLGVMGEGEGQGPGWQTLLTNSANRQSFAL